MPSSLTLFFLTTAFVLAGILGCVRPAATGAGPVLHPSGPAFGAYDPADDYGSDQRVAIEHIFIPWADSDPAAISVAADRVRVRGRTLMVSLEPWSWHSEVTPDGLLGEIFSGARDDTIARYCGVIGDLDVPVYVRWGHEMENDVGRYPWASWEPAQYIRAFRYFVTMCRQHAPVAQFVWSPLGHPWLRDYFPGHDYVDVIGLSVYGLQAYDRLAFGTYRSFFEVYLERSNWVREYDLPIMIAELGYRGDERFARLWAEQALADDPRVPRPVAVVYFNAQEVAPWPKGLGLPDWRVNHNIVP